MKTDFIDRLRPTNFVGPGFLYVRFALVRSGDGEFHPFRDVGRVVADALEVFCDHENIEHALAVRGALRDLRDEILPHRRTR